MRVFLAGGTGAVGRRLVPHLVARGHQVTATTTSAAGLGVLEPLGAAAVVMNGLDGASVGEAVAAARPDVVVHQMTALSAAHAGKPDLRHPDRFFALTNRLRTEGTDHLLAAAQAAGVPHVVAQSCRHLERIRDRGWVKTEEDLLQLSDVANGGSRGRRRSGTWRTRSSRPAARCCATARCTGRAPPTTRSSSSARGSSRSSAEVPGAPRGCTWTTRRALRCWPWSRGARACSTSSTTTRPRCGSGCPTWPRAPGRGGRCGSRRGWPGWWPGRWR